MGEVKVKDKVPVFSVSGIAAKVRNIDGRPMGADGKPMAARRNVKFAGPERETSSGVSSGKVDNETNIGAAIGMTNDDKGSHVSVENLVMKTDDVNSSQDLPKVSVDDKTNEVSSCVSEGRNGNDGPISYAKMLATEKPKRVVNFRLLQDEEKIGDADVTIPRASVIEVQKRFENSLYGYFLGKRLAFPIVENYVKNAWAKFGISRVMMNANGFFFFKFSSKAGMERVLEEGPWLIRAIPLILNVWSPSVNLMKQDIVSVPVWVKLHDVPLVAFTEDGLSMIATKIGTPKMLDAYTSAMCLESWGRNSYARALIELHANQEVKDDIVVAVPDLEGKGYTTQKVHVEYEWKPPRCDTCKTFGHTIGQCPKNIQVVRPSEGNKDGFKEVTRKGKGKVVMGTGSKPTEGVKLNKPKPNFIYRPIQKTSKPNDQGASSSAPHASTGTSKDEGINYVEIRNSFAALQKSGAIIERIDEANNDGNSGSMGTSVEKDQGTRNLMGKEQALNMEDDSDGDDVESVYEETQGNEAKNPGASTPVNVVPNV